MDNPESRRARIARTWRAQRAYGQLVLWLVRPGEQLESLTQHPVKPASDDHLHSWTEEDRKLLMEEGRRQLDRQYSEFERVQARAQWLFTAGIPLLVLLASQYDDVRDDACTGDWILWGGSMAGVLYGVLGAAAVLTVRADFRRIDAAVLSNYSSPVERQLAGDYAAMLTTGEETVVTRLHLFRLAVVWVVLGSLLGLITWVTVS